MHPGTEKVPAFLHHMLPYIQHYGYWAVLIGVMIEDFGIPVPGETIILTAAVLAGAGHFNIAWVILFAVVGAVLGDSIGFFMGRNFGSRVLFRLGLWVGVKEESFHRLMRWLLRFGPWLRSQWVSMASFCHL